MVLRSRDGWLVTRCGLGCSALSARRLAVRPAPPSQPLPLSLSGVILPGETKHFTFFFKSLNAGIFRESWEFGTHPTLLGGAVLQVTLHAISLTQDTFVEERKLLEVGDLECQPWGQHMGHSGVPPGIFNFPILRGDFFFLTTQTDNYSCLGNNTQAFMMEKMKGQARAGQPGTLPCSPELEGNKMKS